MCLLASLVAPRLAAQFESEHLLDNETLLILQNVLHDRDPRRLANSRTDLPPGAREILRVTSHIVLSQTFQSDPGQPVQTATVVILRGQPSRTSFRRLTRAMLVFYRNPETLKPPLLDKGNGMIELSFALDQLDAVLKQLSEHETAYCWIGTFPDGTLYGDLQSRP